MGQIGDILKAARLNKGITIKVAEEETKIRAKYLEALENESFHEIPGTVYVKGFLNNYAAFLGLDAQEMVQLFKETNPRQEEDIIIEPQKPIAQQKKYRKKYKFRPNKYLRYALGVVASIIILFLVNSMWHASNPTVDTNQENSSQVEKKDDTTSKEQAANNENKQKEEPKQDNTQQQPAPTPQPTGVHLILNADKGVSWIRISVDGALAFEGNINQGETKNFDGKEKITIRLGNAGAVNINYNGSSIGYLGEIGNVVDKEFVPANN